MAPHASPDRPHPIPGLSPYQVRGQIRDGSTMNLRGEMSAENVRDLPCQFLTRASPAREWPPPGASGEEVVKPYRMISTCSISASTSSDEAPDTG